MKNVLKKLSLLLSFALVIMLISCKNDDGPKIGGDGGSFNVADGFYLAKVNGEGYTIANGNKLKATKVEADGFGTQVRDGFYQGYMFLSVGSYIYGEVFDQELSQELGGTASTFNDDESGNGDSYNGSYTVVDLSAGGTASFSVATAGMYLVTFDSDTEEGLLVPITDWGVIGGGVFESACVSNGFNSDIDIDVASATEADGAVFSATGIILKNGEYKFRINDNWKIDRRSDNSSFDFANGYVALTNIGGSSLSALEEGGANIPISGANNGTYTITLTINASGQISVTLTKTGDAPVCTFDPANYTWGIIGAATQGSEGRAGWSDDKKLTYINGDGGVHKWRGVFPLAGGTADNMFKFRTDNTWATKLLPTTANVTDNTAEGTLSDDGDTNSDGQWFIADGRSGFFYIVISTADQGATWDISIDEASFGIIGDGAAGWGDTDDVVMTYDDNLMSASANTNLVSTGSFKFRVNASWDFNFGGALEALVYNSNNLTVTNSGNYNVTITTADGGETYTATAVENLP